ncbi:hypothetical protein J2S19_002973 [Metabacillus malikii]|uniref:Uncharacterized protein n=1 Tax=Metabacillus malikii TaxID=1504265 RepID=A0ABT9ZHF8_9BACI|nr:hypothetical protein [Metabacillus malikii]
MRGEVRREQAFTLKRTKIVGGLPIDVQTGGHRLTPKESR